MVVKKGSSAASKVKHIITASFMYGPFKSKTDAEKIRTKAAAIKGAVVSTVKHTARGYAFTSSTRMGVTDIKQRDKIIAAVKKSAPSARISVKKV